MADSKDAKPPVDPATPPATAAVSASATGAAPHQYTMTGSDFPPPPPGGPPPLHARHPDEIPIPDYDPARPQLAPTPAYLQGQPTAPQAQPGPPAQPEHDPPSDDEKRRARSKAWSDKLHKIGHKAAGPINALANKMGSQAFLPTTMDKECEKAAAILLSFCKDGVYSADAPKTPTTPTTPITPITPGGSRRAKSRERALVTIPRKVINNAVGLAIFTAVRAGFQISASTGSGVLVARRPDGSWSPPSGFQVHSLGAGFMLGVDLCDCVCVINTREALKAFMHTRVSLGSDVAIAAGPYGVGGSVDFGAGSGPPHRDRLAAAELEKKAREEGRLPAPATVVEPEDDGKLRPDGKKHKRTSSAAQFGPVFSYVKSRGLYAGIQVDGTVITERQDANAAFYGEPISVEQILEGKVTPLHGNFLWPAGAQALTDALKRAEEVQRPGDPVTVIPPSSTAAASAAVTNQPAPVPQGSHDEAPPAYVEDGPVPPGTGDHKTSYQ